MFTLIVRIQGNLRRRPQGSRYMKNCFNAQMRAVNWLWSMPQAPLTSELPSKLTIDSTLQAKPTGSVGEPLKVIEDEK